MSLVTAVGRSCDVCKLKYLTGEAPVVYGIPFLSVEWVWTNVRVF